MASEWSFFQYGVLCAPVQTGNGNWVCTGVALTRVYEVLECSGGGTVPENMPVKVFISHKTVIPKQRDLRIDLVAQQGGGKYVRSSGSANYSGGNYGPVA